MEIFYRKLTHKERLKRFYITGTPIGILAIFIFFWKFDLLIAISLSVVIINGWFSEIKLLKLQIEMENIKNNDKTSLS